ncbi:ABC transporter ATP-binding protein [Candidatus Saccharibacteria bacterium]|nr:ABC transporter ATP-binding protein [Candidatus Saccharibacteria bacterium]
MPNQDNDTIIELKAVSKRYGFGDAESYALRNFDLTVKRGEFIMIMGPSGCGKTTLLNIIGLLDQASSGEYILAGKNVARVSSRKKARFRAKEIGFIFQNFNLVPNLSIIENVSLPLIYSGYHKTRRLRMADNILEHFHLREREYYMPYQLSGGQQQRVAIARSLIANPSIILADEPTGNLDSRNSHIIMEELQEIHSLGNTIIMVTHNPALTTYATRVINMLDGEIDTDIKTVDDSDLPRSGGKNEKVSVKVLPSRDPIQMEIQSDSDVIVTGENVTTAEPTSTEEPEEEAPAEPVEELPETTEATEELTEKLGEIQEEAKKEAEEKPVIKRKTTKKTSTKKTTRKKTKKSTKKEGKK